MILFQFVQDWHDQAVFDIQNQMHKFRGSSLVLLNTLSFLSQMKPYLGCHQSPKRGRLKVHLGP